MTIRVDVPRGTTSCADPPDPAARVSATTTVFEGVNALVATVRSGRAATRGTTGTTARVLEPSGSSAAAPPTPGVQPSGGADEAWLVSGPGRP